MYYINAHTEQTGKSVIGRNDIASLLNVSVVTAAKRVSPLVESGMVVEKKQRLARGAGYKWVYYITSLGTNNTQAMWQECYRAYNEHIELRKLEALDEIRKLSRPRGKPIKRHEKQMVLL